MVKKDEVSIEIEGRVYTFSMGVNALCAVESLFSRSDRRVPFQEVLRLAQAGSMTHLRGLLWAALQKHHKDVSLEQAGDLITSAGIDLIDAKFAEVLPSLVPDPVDLEALGVSQPRPPQTSATSGGTGAGSADKPAGSGSPTKRSGRARSANSSPSLPSHGSGSNASTTAI